MQLPPETRGLVNGMIGLSTRSKKDTSQWQCVGCRFECGLTADGTTPAHESVWYLAHIRTAVALSHGNYGIPGMHCDLIDQGHQIGRHRTARLMRENQLIARQKRRFKRMTDSEHAWPAAPNLVAQDFTADGPDRKWGADISYIWTAEGWLYLAVVLDLYSGPRHGPRTNGGTMARLRLGHE